VQQKMIYLVDDDEAVRDSARMLLEANDFAVQDFASATDLLQSTGGKGFDCLVLDVHMPGMNGMELLELLRERGIEDPVIVLTGRFDAPMTDRLSKARAAAILQKPAESGELLDAIHSAIQGAAYARA
jgi:FixJ family two-component response regulator